MGMDLGGSSSGPRSDINITPLVDVVLVLLIIFMVVTPMLQVGYETTVPPRSEGPEGAPPPPGQQIVVRLDAEGAAWINQERLARQDFLARLGDLTRNRRTQPIFFAASGELPYSQVSEFLDQCYNHGAPNLAIVLDELD